MVTLVMPGAKRGYIKAITVAISQKKLAVGIDMTYYLPQ